MRSRGWVAHSPVWNATPALNRVPSASRRASRPRPLRAVQPPGRLDLERHDGPVGVFDHQVYFEAAPGPPVSDGGRVVHPRRLLEYLPHGERLKQMTELLERRPVTSCQPFRRETE